MTEMINVRFKLSKMKHAMLREFMKRNGVKNYSDFFDVAVWSVIQDDKR